MEIKPDSILRKNPNIVSSEIDGETVMMDTDFEKYFGMRAVGTRIWQLLEQDTSLQNICQQLVEEYEVTLEQCQEDVAPFLNELAKQDMLILVER